MENETIDWVSEPEFVEENETNYEGYNLHKHVSVCRKNDKHLNFYPFNCCLGEESKLCRIIEILGNLTVKISVNRTVGKRGKYFGSGMLVSLVNIKELESSLLDIKKSASFQERCQFFTIVTALHVISNDEEAKNANIEFFNNEDEYSFVNIAHGLKILASNEDGDFVEVLCVTENILLSSRLKTLLNFKAYVHQAKSSFEVYSHSECYSISESYKIKIYSFEIPKKLYPAVELLLMNTYKDICIHIGHPHGMSKQVTIGEIISTNTDTGHYTFIYNTPTCPGCSGGPVFVVSKDILEQDNNKQIEWDKIFAVPHAKAHNNKDQLICNMSSSWITYFDVSIGDISRLSLTEEEIADIKTYLGFDKDAERKALSGLKTAKNNLNSLNQHVVLRNKNNVETCCLKKQKLSLSKCNLKCLKRKQKDFTKYEQSKYFKKQHYV